MGQLWAKVLTRSNDFSKNYHVNGWMNILIDSRVYLRFEYTKGLYVINTRPHKNGAILVMNSDMGVSGSLKSTFIGRYI